MVAKDGTGKKIPIQEVKHLIQAVTQQQDEEAKTVQPPQAPLRLSTHLLELFVREAVLRASEVAKSEGRSTVKAKDVETIVVSLMLDFQ